MTEQPESWELDIVPPTDTVRTTLNVSSPDLDLAVATGPLALSRDDARHRCRHGGGHKLARGTPLAAVMSLTATLRPEQTLLETAWRVGMPGKRVQFDDETWATIDALARRQRKSFQELSDEAFGDLLKKHRQPVGFKTALKESVAPRGKTR